MMTGFLHADLGRLALRLTVGILMLFHGVAKLGNHEALQFITRQLESFGLPGILAYAVFIGEIVAPIMIIVGILTRFGGFILVINMIFAIVLAHANEVFSLTQHGGWALELQGFYLFCSLAIVFLGSGRYAAVPD